MLLNTIAALLARFEAGDPVVLPKIEKPVDRVFDANVSKIGLLGPALAEDLAYVYNNINAFRIAFGLLSDEAMSLEKRQATVLSARARLEGAVRRAQPLLVSLRKFALMRYRIGWGTGTH